MTAPDVLFELSFFQHFLSALDSHQTFLDGRTAIRILLEGYPFVTFESGRIEERFGDCVFVVLCKKRRNAYMCLGASRKNKAERNWRPWTRRLGWLFRFFVVISRINFLKCVYVVAHYKEKENIFSPISRGCTVSCHLRLELHLVWLHAVRRSSSWTLIWTSTA